MSFRTSRLEVPVFLDELQVPYVLQPLTLDLLRREKPTLVAGIDDLRAYRNELSCLRLIEHVEDPGFPIRRTYVGAVAAFHSAWRDLSTSNQSEPPTPIGPEFYLYDSSQCLF